jgi:prepilin-type N-terminal cleavage/methylation domain-containing protein
MCRVRDFAMNRKFCDRHGFSLVELLIVIVIISVLAGLFLPGLVRAKQNARLTTCVNNLREINVGLRLYIDDHQSRFPLATVVDKDHREKKTTPNLGGMEPAKDRSAYWASAEVRPLYPYLGRSEVCKCPVDKGLLHRTVGDEDTKPLKPSLYATIGCSYQYNGDSCLPFLDGGGYRKEPEGLLPGQIESWVREPVMYVMVYEPPARMWCGKAWSTTIIFPFSDNYNYPPLIAFLIFFCIAEFVWAMNFPPAVQWNPWSVAERVEWNGRWSARGQAGPSFFGGTAQRWLGPSNSRMTL